MIRDSYIKTIIEPFKIKTVEPIKFTSNEERNGGALRNRFSVLGDIVHSTPTFKNDILYTGGNDGMLHAVLDDTDPNVNISGDEINHGTEAWAFIPPDQLVLLKHIIARSTHRDYVDSSPKIYFHDVDEDGRVEPGEGDRVILVCGQRKGGSSYFALDVTDPDTPKYLWRIGSTNDAETGMV